MFEYDKELREFIPPEFDLAKYRTLSNASIESWDYNFSARFFVHADIVDPIVPKITRGYLNDILERLEHYIFFGDITTHPKYTKRSKMHPSINPLQVDYVVDQYSKLIPKLQGSAGKETLLNVNLYESDAVLIEDFKQWLQVERDKKEVEPLRNHYSEAKMRRWHEFRVLAYLDISLWHKLNNITCTNGRMALILYPDDASGIGAERIRKTTKLMADEILNKQLYKLLFKYYFYGE